MATWSSADLAAIGTAEELRISVRRADGTTTRPVPVWVVRVGDDLYVRSYRGAAGAWYRHGSASGLGHVDAGGVSADVALDAPEGQPAGAIDAAYRAKYARFGESFVGPMTTPAAREATLRLVPAEPGLG